MKLFKFRGFVWELYIAYWPDFLRSEDRSVRRAWWFLFHNGQKKVISRDRCYRLCGVTLFGRAKP